MRKVDFFRKPLKVFHSERECKTDTVRYNVTNVNIYAYYNYIRYAYNDFSIYAY